MQTSLHTSYGINFDNNTMNMRNDEAIRATKKAAVRTAKATADAKYAAWQALIAQGAPQADIEAAKAEYGVAAEALLTAQQNLAKFNSDTQTYEDILGDYHSLIYQETTGDPTQYTNFNSKKSNFYVTYGGHLHATSASIEGMGFAIPISDVKDIIETLMNGEDDTSDVTIGIEGFMVDESNIYNMPQGFYISKVLDGSGADKAGLEIGNIVTKVNGKEVTSLTDIRDVLYSKSKGDKITLTIAYANRKTYSEKEVEVTLS
jgi:C-terminal processing protease CtpA/Prc